MSGGGSFGGMQDGQRLANYSYPAPRLTDDQYTASRRPGYTPYTPTTPVTRPPVASGTNMAGQAGGAPQLYRQMYSGDEYGNSYYVPVGPEYQGLAYTYDPSGAGYTPYNTYNTASPLLGYTQKQQPQPTQAQQPQTSTVQSQFFQPIYRTNYTNYGAASNPASVSQYGAPPPALDVNAVYNQFLNRTIPSTPIVTRSASVRGTPSVVRRAEGGIVRLVNK